MVFLKKKKPSKLKKQLGQEIINWSLKCLYLRLYQCWQPSWDGSQLAVFEGKEVKVETDKPWGLSGRRPPFSLVVFAGYSL